MQPDPTRLLEAAKVGLPLVGLYDAPDPETFAPLVEPPAGSRVCVFAYFRQWRKGRTLHLTREQFGCAGAARALCGVEARPREDLIRFLVDEEGLKESRERMAEWVEHAQPYAMEHDHVLIGPLREAQYDHLKTVTFFLNPDQLAFFMYGAHYHSRPSDPPATIAAFGSGCMQLVGLFEDLAVPQAAIGSLDIAMRQYLPPDVLAFTVTRPMFERLCSLDDRSFIAKPFWQRVLKAREWPGGARVDEDAE